MPLPSDPSPPACTCPYTSGSTRWGVASSQYQHPCCKRLWVQRAKLQYHKQFLNCAFNFNLRRYNKGLMAGRYRLTPGRPRLDCVWFLHLILTYDEAPKSAAPYGLVIHHTLKTRIDD